MTGRGVPGTPLPEWLARLNWFALTGDVKQWSGPEEVNPLPDMQADTKQLLSRVAQLEAALREAMPFMTEFAAAGNVHAPKVVREMKRALLSTEGATK